LEIAKLLVPKISHNADLESLLGIPMFVIAKQRKINEREQTDWKGHDKNETDQGHQHDAQESQGQP
jgi:hypothetical protein